MNDTKHAPTPWTTEQATIRAADGTLVAECGDPSSNWVSPEEIALAERIAADHNAHDELVTALRYYANLGRDIPYDEGSTARAALAKVQS